MEVAIPPPVDLPLSAAYDTAFTALIAQMDATGSFKARLAQIRAKMDQLGRGRDGARFDRPPLSGPW